MRGGEFLGKFTKIYVEPLGEVVYSVVPVLSGEFSLCEVRATNLQATSPCPFN